MFHLMLVLPILIIGIVILAIIALLVILAVTAIAGAIAGGTSVALLVKNKTAKKLMLIGFSIIFLIGASCLLPALIAFTDLSSLIAFILSLVFGAAVIALSICGIVSANKLQKKGAKIPLLTIFSVILTITLCVLSVEVVYAAIVASV